MIFFQDAAIEGVAIHKVGNVGLDEGVTMSDQLLTITEDDRSYLMNFFCKPFFKMNQVYQLYHPNGAELNVVNHIASNFLVNNVDDLLNSSKNFARHLYESTNHPKIKGGEFYTVHFSGVQFEGEEFEAIGLFKSDITELYARVTICGSAICEFTQAINTNQLDKAALILKSPSTDGYTILVPEIKNTTESSYWKDDFLQVIGREDSYFKTKKMLALTKDFIINKLDEVFDLNQVDKADLLNESIAYFKKHEQFEQEEFVQDVFNNDTVSGLFASYITTLQEEYDLQPLDDFEISNNAVQSAQKSFKKVLKLDKNFQVHIHGTKELIESGYDDKKGMNYYKLYFNNEH